MPSSMPAALQLPASATLADSQMLLSLLDKALAAGAQGARATGPVEVDASALQNFDTSTIALLMQARRLAQEAGRSFSVQGVPAKLLELARLYGVEELLSAAESGSANGSEASGQVGSGTGT